MSAAPYAGPRPFGRYGGHPDPSWGESGRLRWPGGLRAAFERAVRQVQAIGGDPWPWSAAASPSQRRSGRRGCTTSSKRWPPLSLTAPKRLTSRVAIR